MKNSRQDEILQIIEREDVDTQELLIAKLEQAGYSVTQATVSRDIRELGLVKRMTSAGHYRYEIPARDDTITPNFVARLTESVKKLEVGGNIVVIHTYPGMANAVAACIDQMHLPEILGCVAGDDTIIVVSTDGATAKALSAKLRRTTKNQ